MDNLPHDLADVLKILHEWQPMHTDGHLVSIPGNVPLLNLRLSLPHDINAFPFSKYASRHIRDHRLGITQDPLRLPFLPKHSSQDNRDSLEIFTLILSYMFERRLSEDRRMVLADYIIQKGLSVESLRDEIYVQLINQTIGKGPDSAWLLLASCLSTFAPSTTLAKHLLKYVSDAGVDGFDAVCQQKLLQCYGLEPELSRSYPPCLLEWTTNRLKAAMALYAGFSDGEKGVCQVESWTTGEQFAINMFRSRHITDNLKGWSVQLRDDVDTYECAGYDYVLDLVSEMELPPSFPCLTAYFLTMTDISRPASTTRRHWPDEPHNAEKLRIMPLEVDELRDQPVAALPVPVPLPQSPPPPSPSPPPKRISIVEEQHPKPSSEDVYGKANGALPKGSALNQRKDHVPDELSKTSRLNSRYSQGHTQADTSRAPAEPAKHNHHNHAPHQPAKQRHVQPPVAEEPPPARRRNRPASQQPQQPQQQQQQQPQKPEGEDMSAWLDSVFREALSGGGAGGAGGAGAGGAGGHGGLGNPQAVSRNMKGGEEDMSAWVDSVFQEALSGAGGAGRGGGRQGDIENSRDLSRNVMSGEEDMSAWVDSVFQEALSGAGGAGRAGGRQGDIENSQTVSRNVMGEEEDAWLDSIFREALSGAGGAGGGGQGGLGDVHAVSRNMKGGEDNLQQTQFGLVSGGVSGSYGLNSFGIQSAAGAVPASSTVFPSSVLQAQSAALSQLSSGMPTVITQTAMPPSLPVVVDPAMQLMHQQQFIQQQQQQQQQQLHQQQQQQQQLLQHLRLQHQQQIQMHQHAAELQVQLQTKELEKQVLQSTIHAEMLKQQLQHLQDSKHPQPQKGQQQQQQGSQQQQQQQQPQQQQQQQVSQQVQQQHQQLLHHQRPQSSVTTTSSSSSSSAAAAGGGGAVVMMRHSFASADDHHTRPHRPVIINSGSYIHPAVPETRQRVPGEVDESRPGGVQTLKRSYLTKSTSDPKPIPLPAVAKQVTAVAIANNRARPPVRFADNIIEESSEDEDAAPAPPRPPSPPIVKKENKAAAAAKAPQKLVIIETKPVKRTPSAAQVIKPAAAVVVTKTVVTRTVNAPQETNGEVEDGPRKPPGKIGIKWPPEPEKTEKQTIPVNRLVIMETKEEQMAIRKAQSAEDIQQKMNNRIRSSQQAAEREVPAPPPVRRPPPPAAVTKTSEVQMEEAGTQVQSWNNKIDMATKKKELETLLKDAQWGTQNRKESPLAPPPVHHPPPPVSHESQSAYDLSRLDSIRTVLHAQCTSPFYAYKNVPWSLEIRKEVFSPSENLNNPVLVDIVFVQIATDVLSGDSIRITQDDKRKMRKILDTHGVNLRNIGTGHSTQAKKAVIKAAKELPIFFARIFPVNGGSKQSRVQMVAVSHSGVRLLARHKDVFDDYIIVFEQIKFSDVIDVHVPKSSTILMRLTGRNIVLYTKYASQLCGMLNSYRQEHSEIIPKIRINDNDDDDD